MASAPRMARNSPESESSPANSYSSSALPGSCPEATRMPSAIGKSKRPLSLGRSAGARLTVTRRAGKSKPQFTSAARTRSRDSLTSVSGRPTMVKLGNPPARCTSTATAGASAPVSARLCNSASAMRSVLLRLSRLESGHARFQLREFLLRARKQFDLDVELLARHQIEPREGGGHHGTHIPLDVLGRTLRQDFADTAV